MNSLDVPRLQHPDLVVQRLSLADAGEWADYVTLPEVTRFTSSTARTVDDVRAVIERSLAGEPASPVLFGVRLESSGQFVATVGFHTVQPHNRSAEITYDVRPTHWDQGIARACCQGAVGWGFEVRGWVRIQATTQEPHLASQAVLLKSGFKPEGRLRNFRIVRGAPCDYLMFAIVPGDLAPGSAPATSPRP